MSFFRILNCMSLASALLFLHPLAGQAEDAGEGTAPEGTVPEGTAGKAEATIARISISEEECRRLAPRLAAHRPSADVTYTPGLDVNGNAVAPADLPGSLAGSAAVVAPRTITIPLTLELADFFGGSENVSAEGDIGRIEYDIASGALLFNGQRLGDPHLEAIAAACAGAEKQ